MCIVCSICCFILCCWSPTSVTRSNNKSKLSMIWSNLVFSFSASRPIASSTNLVCTEGLGGAVVNCSANRSAVGRNYKDDLTAECTRDPVNPTNPVRRSKLMGLQQSTHVSYLNSLICTLCQQMDGNLMLENQNRSPNVASPLQKATTNATPMPWLPDVPQF